MKEFLINNFSSIVGIVLSLLSLIAIVCKKMKLNVEDTAFERLLVKLPEIIRKAEEFSNKGAIKKSYVLSVAYGFLAELTGKPVDEVSSIYGERICNCIEAILETPEKKGDLNNEKI